MLQKEEEIKLGLQINDQRDKFRLNFQNTQISVALTLKTKSKYIFILHINSTCTVMQLKQYYFFSYTICDRYR